MWTLYIYVSKDLIIHGNFSKHKRGSESKILGNNGLDEQAD